MSEKNSLARKTYWSKMTPEQRSKRMRDIVTKKHRQSTFAERRAHALKMVAARRAKQKLKVVK